MPDLTEPRTSSALLALTTQIVCSHIEANPLDAASLPKLIQSVHDALAGVDAAPPPEARKEPAVPIKRSVFSDYIICLEDGHKATMLKRYIERRYGLTPQQYRAKWGLPSDYPMVAPAYSERRSTLAKEAGLGRKRAAQVEVKRIPEGKRGRKVKEAAE